MKLMKCNDHEPIYVYINACMHAWMPYIYEQNESITNNNSGMYNTQ